MNENSENSVRIPVKSHNGEPIKKIEVSPKGECLITYSKNDHSIVSWNAENVDEGPKQEFDRIKVNLNSEHGQMCVSDYKKFAYISSDYKLGKS
jgi:hypothetical protein